MMPTRDFIEACYQRRDTFPEWAGGVMAQAVKLHGRTVGFGAYNYRLRQDGAVEIIQLFANRGSDLAHDPLLGPRAFIEFVNASPQRDVIVPATFGSADALLLLSDLPVVLARRLRQQLPLRADDSMCMRGYYDAEGFHLCVLGANRFALSDRRRSFLEGLSRHVAAGYRVQRALAALAADDDDVVLAVASAGGGLLHATGRFRRRDIAQTFIDQVKRKERARCRRIRQSPEETAHLWQAFIDGEYSLVDSVDSDGRRMILAVRNQTRATGLTAQERRVVAAVAGGGGNKAVAGELGISASTVAVHLHSAMRKLGFQNRQSLVACLERGSNRDTNRSQGSSRQTAPILRDAD